MSAITRHRSPHPLHVALIFKLLVVLGLIAVPVSLYEVKLPRVERIASVDELQSLFADLDYSLHAARKGTPVPRLAISDVPDNWAGELDTAARKQIFFETVLPLVLIVNEAAEARRDRLAALDERRRKDKPWRSADRHWLAETARLHGVDLPDGGSATEAALDKALAELRSRVGPVPPSLALAQAAVESAYGTSRFAVAGNALFGQWTTSAGVKPAQQRASKAAFDIAAFGSPLQSVEAYVRNLNTHSAYRRFRAERQRLERSGSALSGETLAGTLSAYSERGAAYIETLRVIIRINQLAGLDSARLDDGGLIRLLVP